MKCDIMEYLEINFSKMVILLVCQPVQNTNEKQAPEPTQHGQMLCFISWGYNYPLKVIKMACRAF
jgi:hypothetical protein